ncbi:MAG: hypothetical protein IT292_00755 [Deltaproteobacteria bacterium]|nr:hypothetical protein [Deltaproteobacteria bacterium]
MKYLLSLLLALSLMACGSSGGDDEATDTSSSSSSSSSSVAIETHYFGQNGNLWKPAGDPHGGSPGNLVVLFSSQFQNQFDRCEVTLNTGEVSQLICINDQPWTQVPYSCFTNGDRQTWRASAKCSSMAEVKATCYSGVTQYVFTVVEANRHAVCSRF